MQRLISKNWSEFQHYKDRSPAWIKLHKKLIDDYEFQCLPVASRALAPMLWLLASEEEDGSIEYNTKKIAFRLRTTQEEIEQAVKPLIKNGFFSFVSDCNQGASDMLAECLPREEIEKEIEREIEREGEIEREVAQPSALPDEPPEIKKSKKGTRLADDWEPSKKNLDYIRDNRPDLNPVIVAERFRNYWISQAGAKGIKLDWDATWRNWCLSEKSTPVTMNQTKTFASKLYEQNTHNAQLAKQMIFGGKSQGEIIDHE